MTLKEELNKAYFEARVQQKFGGPYPDPDKVLAFGAKWMAEWCAKEADTHWLVHVEAKSNVKTIEQASDCGQSIACNIRQLAKGLE